MTNPVRLVLASCLALAGLASAAHATAALEGPARRVWIVGIDGAGFPNIDPLIEQGGLPAMAELFARGVSAELETVEPVISPTVWTSIATGRSPAAHGVSDFLKRASDIAAPTIFERLAAQGVRVGAYDWLVSWPPQALPGGFVIPGWMRRDDATEPPGVLGEGYRYRLRGVFGRPAYAANARAELAKKADQWLALAERHDPELGALIFYSVDGLSHRFWHDAYPESFDGAEVPAPEPGYEGLVEEALRGVDRAVGRIAASMGPDDVLILASDHGFEAADSFRRVWSLRTGPALARAGLVPGREAFSIDGEFGAGFVRIHAGDFATQDALLERLHAFYRDAATPEGQPLFTVERLDRAERPPGAERPILDRLRQWVIDLAVDWLFGIQLDPDAFAHLVIRPDGELLEGLARSTPVRLGGHTFELGSVIDADGFSGEHHPTAIFAAAGGPIRAVPERGTLSVLDVAPLVLWLLGSELPDDLEGQLPEAWIEPTALREHPPRTAPADSFRTLPRPAERSPENSEAELIERLRSMGYVE